MPASIVSVATKTIAKQIYPSREAETALITQCVDQKSVDIRHHSLLTLKYHQEQNKRSAGHCDKWRDGVNICIDLGEPSMYRCHPEGWRRRGNARQKTMLQNHYKDVSTRQANCETTYMRYRSLCVHLMDQGSIVYATLRTKLVTLQIGTEFRKMMLTLRGFQDNIQEQMIHDQKKHKT